MKKKKNKILRSTSIAAVGAALKDVSARHGAAVNEWLAAYDGINYEAGFTPRARMQKSFKSIAKSRFSRDPNSAKANIKQQAGFDAELIEVTQERADAAARGEKPHTLRMDDAGPKGARHSNDQFIDIVEVDTAGNPIPGSGYQMKFVGSTPEKCLGKLLGKKCRKYLDNNVDIAIPSDYFDKVKDALDKKISDVKIQIKSLEKKCKPVPAAKRQELEHCKKLRRCLRKSEVSNADAIEARTKCELFTTKKVLQQAHKAGIEGAKVGASVAGVLSGVSNLLAMARGDKTWKEAAIDTTRDALVAGAGGYFTAAGGVAISGVMMKSSSAIVRAMGKSGFPGVAITFVISGATTLCRYFNGEMRGSDCMDELSNLGTSMAIGSVAYGAIAASSGASVLAVGGVALLPMAGAILSSMVASAVFTGLKNWAYKDAYAAEARAREVEARCAEACRMLNAYKQQIDDYFKSSNIEFFKFMNKTLFMIDSNDFEISLAGANEISIACGGKVHVANITDVDSLMSCPFKIGRG